MDAMTDQPFLSGRLALVTGASRGIGAAIAERLAGAGAHVVLTARSADALEAVEERIHAAGGTATIAPLDLTERDSIARLAKAVSERWQALDILVLNAAMLGSLSPVAQLEGKELSRLFTLNVLAQQTLIAAFDPLLRRAEAGRLLALTSSVGAEARPYWGGYGASKAALENLVESYAAEMRNVSAVRAALIDPGATRTEMRARAFPGEDPQDVKPPEDVADAVAALLRADFETGTRHRV
jgi:NAD(P)-dependent dehydrogenase (short-subunit alcohol dehydrogenase family)